MTKFQKITLILWLLYIVWEIAVQIWARNEAGPIIRVDLLVIVPVLAICSIISIVQWVRNSKKV